MAAYPIARLELPGKGLLLTILILTQMVPAIVLAIPMMLIFEAVGLRDTVPGLIIANVAWSIPLGIWLLRNVFEEIPRSLDAAARMDGCSRLGTLFRIMIPTARPGLAATAILLLIGTWNEFLFAVILGNQGAVTVTRQIGFIDATGPTGVPPYTLQAAAGVVAAIPAVLLVAFFYRRIVAGVSEGFVKG
jgi:multiple sugar transport system permease protein